RILEYRRNRIRMRRSLRPQRIHKRPTPQHPIRRVPLLQKLTPLSRRQKLQPADRNIRPRNRTLQKTNQPPPQRLNARPIKQVRSIIQSQLQPLARGDHQAQWVMCRVVPTDVAQPNARRRPRQAAMLHRVVLKHHQRVEQLAQSSQLLDLRKPEMLVRNQSGLAVLHLLEHIQKRLARRQLDPQRQRVDEQPHHALNAANLRRSARYRDPKDNVIAPGQTGEQDRPCRLDEGIKRQTLLPRLPRERRGEFLAQPDRDPPRRPRQPRPTGRRHPRRLPHSLQSLPPRRNRPRAILRRDPPKIIAVRR